MKNVFAILMLCPVFAFCQLSDSGNVVTLRSKKNIFKDAEGNNISSAVYSKLSNSGLYVLSIAQTDSGVNVLGLDSSDLLKSLYRKKVPVVVKDINGKTLTIPSPGKVTVLNFWSTTCAPCIAEIDSLNLLVKRFPNVAFIAITQDSISLVKRFLLKREFKYDIVADCGNIMKGVFFVSANPTHFVYDPFETLKKIEVGKSPDLANSILSILSREK
jgi:thiol-disulfide isomerase/thioredoxin